VWLIFDVRQKKMSAHATAIPDARPLEDEERVVIGWLIDHGTGDVALLRSQLDHASVAAKCGCGCASIDIAVERTEGTKEGPMQVVADFAWKTNTGHLCGAYLFTRGGHLGGLDLWSIDGAETPSALPAVERLFPYAKLARG
jgi:hypothetical protein